MNDDEAICEAGYTSWEMGQTLDDNPYDPITNSVNYVLWRTGWFNAEEDHYDDPEVVESQEWADYDPDC